MHLPLEKFDKNWENIIWQIEEVDKRSGNLSLPLEVLERKSMLSYKETS